MAHEHIILYPVTCPVLYQVCDQFRNLLLLITTLLLKDAYRFDELLTHLNAFKCEKVVALGEDATRVIKKVQYDPNTNKLVGFVLPCEESGLPLCDSFMATTFESMENHFCDESIANYAFAYMAQPLAENVPAFCLSCLGTNNKFNAELVYIKALVLYLL